MRPVPPFTPEHELLRAEMRAFVETVAFSALASSGVNARSACWTREPS